LALLTGLAILLVGLIVSFFLGFLVRLQRHSACVVR